ncbi:MAG: MFS transporter [Alphaproteobacteria bacterium]
MPTAATARPNLTSWLIVMVCFLGLSISFSARSILGLTMPLWERELGWSRSFISTGGALTLLTMALIAPVTGNLVDRFGPRRVFLAGLAAIAAGMGLASATSSQWQFILLYCVLAGAGFGIVAMHVVSTTIALYFTENRGLATGIGGAGSTSGQLLIIPILALVLETVGWRLSYVTLAVLAVALMPVVMIFVKSGPIATARSAVAPAEPLGRRLGSLLRSPVFHALFWSYAVCGFTTSGVIETHMLPYAAACGFPPLDGAAAYGVLSAFNLVGMLGAGYLSDRVHRPTLLATIYIVRGLSFILLMQIVGDLKLLFTFAVMFGLADYATVPVTASLVASHMGLRIMGLTMGLLTAGHQAGGALGAFLGGVLYDLFAQYEWVWSASIVLAIAAGFIVLTIPGRGPDLRPAAALA